MNKYTQCKTCTIQLVTKAYERAPWFRLIREPLVALLILFAFIKGYRAQNFSPPSETCRGCPRFLKNILKERSPVFNRLHDFFNPLFDSIIQKIVTDNEIAEAKKFAASSTQNKET